MPEFLSLDEIDAISRHPVTHFGQSVAPADPSRGSSSKAEAFMDIRFHDWDRNMTAAPDDQALASRWNWVEDDVRAFLSDLRSHGLIAAQGPAEVCPAVFDQVAADLTDAETGTMLRVLLREQAGLPLARKDAAEAAARGLMAKGLIEDRGGCLHYVGPAFVRAEG